MKKSIIPIALLGIFLASSCKKKVDCEEYYEEKEIEFCGTEEHKDWGDKDDYYEKESYQKEIVGEIVKSEDCECIVSGVIEYYEDDNLVATVDYGDGTCDEVATKTDDEGNVSQFNPCEKDKDFYSKDYDKSEYEIKNEEWEKEEKKYWWKKKKYTEEECEEMVYPEKQ